LHCNTKWKGSDGESIQGFDVGLESWRVSFVILICKALIGSGTAGFNSPLEVPGVGFCELVAFDLSS